MNISMWRYYSATWVLSENILLWYILYQKPWKFLNSKKVDFFIKVGKIDFYWKLKVQIKNGVQIWSILCKISFQGIFNQKPKMASGREFILFTMPYAKILMKSWNNIVNIVNWRVASFFSLNFGYSHMVLVKFSLFLLYEKERKFNARIFKCDKD